MVGEADLRQTGELMRFTISANMAGIPAITVPVGQCSGGTSCTSIASVAHVHWLANCMQCWQGFLLGTPSCADA